MLLTDTQALSDVITADEAFSRHISKKKYRTGLMLLIYLFLACLGTSWFAYQCFFVSQPQSFAPDWQAAQWIHATDGVAPIAYFRYTTNIGAVPDGAIITIAANQTFRLYVNTTFIGTNESDFLQGDALRPDIYDITSTLQNGPNVIVIRVANLDQHVPAVRANIHFKQGNFNVNYGTDAKWHATIKSNLVYPGNVQSLHPWSNPNFNETTWPVAHSLQQGPVLSPLTANPMLYTQPLSRQWISSGVGAQAYFVRQIQPSSAISSYWVRFASSGPATLFVNGQIVTSWTGQPLSNSQNAVGSLGYLEPGVKFRTRFIVGIYDLAPYLHSGSNTLAIYVSTPGVNGLLGTVNASMMMDTLSTNSTGQAIWDESIQNWRSSSSFTQQWNQTNTATHAWLAPVPVANPTVSRHLYMPDNNALLERGISVRNTQSTPLAWVGEVIFWSTLAVLSLWLFMSFTWGRRYYRDLQSTLIVMSVAYLPALACELLLAVLTREPLIPGPFPYNRTIGLLLMLVVLATYLLLWLNTVLQNRRNAQKGGTGFSVQSTRTTERVQGQDSAFKPLIRSRLTLPMKSIVRESTKRLGSQSDALLRNIVGNANTMKREGERIRNYRRFLLSVLRDHWILLPPLLVTIPLIFSTLTYEPYWQDELVSFYVSKNSIAHGFPMMPSGFIYPKAELFAYLLGLVMFIFGDQGGTPRLLSAVEFILSIPLLYFVGTSFFGRRVGWLATAMLALSPFALVWGAQVRMYEQAQVCVLIVLYIFYKAAIQPHNRRLPYIAVFCLIVAYLSHEEIFIILPGLVLCIFMLSKSKGRFFPAVCYQKHWWFAALLGASIIGIQLLNVRFSHPPVLGTDQSMRPDVQLNENGLPFYIKLLFFPKNTNAWLTINSILATAACLYALHKKDVLLRYCTLFLVTSLAVLAFLFTLEADRYFYPLLPIYYLLGAYILWQVLHGIWTFASRYLTQTHNRQGIDSVIQEGALLWPARILALFTASLVCSSVLIAPMLPISKYNVGVSRLLGLSYYRHFADYDVVGKYVKQHWQRGDIIISISPDIEMYYYVGQSDYYFSIDRALFLIEHNGQIVNTSTAATALLNQSDFQAVLARHTRIWLVSDHSQYEAAVLKRFIFPTDFHIAFEGARDIVYLRGS